MKELKEWFRDVEWLDIILTSIIIGFFIWYAINNNKPKIRCVDGTHSNSSNRSGTCSYHGGIN